MGEAKRRRQAGGSGGGESGAEQRWSMAFKLTDKKTGANRVLHMDSREQDFDLLPNIMSLYLCNVIAQTINMRNPAVKTYQEALDLCSGLADTLVEGAKTGTLNGEVAEAMLAVLHGLEALYGFIRARNGTSVGVDDLQRLMRPINAAFDTKVSPLALSLGVKDLYRTVAWDERAVETVFANLMALPEGQRDALHAKLFPTLN